MKDQMYFYKNTKLYLGSKKNKKSSTDQTIINRLKIGQMICA
jgi:hypothetical protein